MREVRVGRGKNSPFKRLVGAVVFEEKPGIVNTLDYEMEEKGNGDSRVWAMEILGSAFIIVFVVFKGILHLTTYTI